MQAPHARPGAVTTGPIRGSRKVYLSPPGHPGLRVPLREIALDDPQTPRLHLYAGADRAQVVANLRADRTGGEGPARLVLVARDDEWADVRQRALRGGLIDHAVQQVHAHTVVRSPRRRTA